MTPAKIKEAERLLLNTDLSVPAVAKRLVVSEGSIYAFFRGGKRALIAKHAKAKKHPAAKPAARKVKRK